MMLELMREEGQDKVEDELDSLIVSAASSIESNGAAVTSGGCHSTTRTSNSSRAARIRNGGGRAVSHNNNHKSSSRENNRRRIGLLTLLSGIGFLVVMILPWMSHYYSGDGGTTNTSGTPTAMGNYHWNKKKVTKNNKREEVGSRPPLSNFRCPSDPIRKNQNNEDDEAKETYGSDKEPMLFDPTNQSSTTYFLETFRNQSFDGWSHTYTEIKQRLYDWKATQFAPYLHNNGSSIYESACGLGLNLYLTLEILHETSGLHNLTIYGNEYVTKNAEMATPLLQTLLANQSLGNRLGGSGTICQGDSTDLSSWVPANSFDLVFTGYISPLWDPLNFGLEEVDNYHRLKTLCQRAAAQAAAAAAAAAAAQNTTNNHSNEDDEDTHQDEYWMGTKLIEIAQQRQEDWFATWIQQLIRIAKPGAPVVVEEVAFPYCDILHDYGGVSQDFFSTGHKVYGRDIDPTSIVFQNYKRDSKKRRYHVFMLKNNKKP